MCLKATDFSFSAAATATATSGDVSEDASGLGTSFNMGEYEIDSRDEGNRHRRQSKPAYPSESEPAKTPEPRQSTSDMVRMMMMMMKRLICLACILTI